MLFQWWRKLRRSRLLSQPFPGDWEPWLQRGCRILDRLSPDEQQLLRSRLRLLVAEKHWEGCGGLAVTDEMRVTIAAQAALMTLGFSEIPFERLLSILLYPDTYVARPIKRNAWGLEDETAEPRLGEAWYQGPVILSWRDVRRQCIEEDDGRNVVIHEFAHLLDVANAEVDGIPALSRDVNPQQWARVFQEEFRRFLRHLQLGRNRVLDEYAGTNPAEFFAVGSEAFFERPIALRQSSPQLYQLLQSYYRQDPAARASA